MSVSVPRILRALTAQIFRRAPMPPPTPLRKIWQQHKTPSLPTMTAF